MITGFQRDAFGEWIGAYPGSLKDYTVDWSAWLEEQDDTIASSAWTIPSGLTSSSPGSTETTATIWLTGVTAGQVYTVINTITTAAGRVEPRAFRVVGKALQ